MEKPLSQVKTVSRRFEALGTLNEITVYERTGSTLLNSVERRVREIDDLMSVFKPDSDIAKLNRASGHAPVPLHPETVRLLALSKTVAEQSGGAFDVTIGPLTALWKIGLRRNEIPPLRKINRAKKLVNSTTLISDVLNSKAALAKPGQTVDLGGIAKGYAADEAKRILLADGIQSALIDLGGNVVALGTRPDGLPWKIGIQNPLAPRGVFLGWLHAEDRTVVTSGCNERFFIRDGKRFHHILDPRTGQPADSGLLSVTVVCGHSVMADALSTALFVLGLEQGLLLLQKFHAEAVFATEQGKIFVTNGLSGQFTAIS